MVTLRKKQKTHTYLKRQTNHAEYLFYIQCVEL